MYEVLEWVRIAYLSIGGALIGIGYLLALFIAIGLPVKIVLKLLGK